MYSVASYIQAAPRERRGGVVLLPGSAALAADGDDIFDQWMSDDDEVPLPQQGIEEGGIMMMRTGAGGRTMMKKTCWGSRSMG